jgi:transcriptional regulator with XRE-family HTH domain
MPADQPAWVLQIRQQVGRRIRDLRTDRGLSQERLAELAGISRHTMYRTETATHAASTDVIVRIARVLDVPPDRLFRDE